MNALTRALLMMLLVTGAARSATPEDADPRSGRVPLPAGPGWEAQLCLDRGDVGVWTAKSYPLLSSVGSDEVVALDDEGCLHVLVPYSGRWSGPRVLREGKWLGGLCHGDVDGTVPGAELYTGGARGNLWQVLAHADGAVETRRVAKLLGREIHTLVVADVDPKHAGNELVMFTVPGAIYVVHEERGRFVAEQRAETGVRIRDCVVLPPRHAGGPSVLATVSRAGVLALLRFEDGTPHFEPILRVKTGMGRIARRAPTDGRPEILYVVCDDGRVYRVAAHEGGWKPELIYAGPEGMRGVVCGSFDADPTRETIAVFGYAARVELLTRHDAGWRAETIFRARGKGHWLCTAEVDGRNATPEILCCGYGGRLVMLSRPPGFGRPGTLAVSRDGAQPAALRLGLAGIPRRDGVLSPNSYLGGFRLKTLVYETLVGAGADGEPAPRLAASWTHDAARRIWTFTLRQDARFHDGRPCDASAVVAWFESWLGHEDHGWLRMNGLVERVDALDAQRVRFTLREAFPLPQELAAVNPCAVGVPGRPGLGTGPWRVERYDPARGATLRRVADGRRLTVSFLHGGDHVSRSHVEALRAGTVDAVADGWVPHLPRAAARALAAEEEGIELRRAPGSRTVYLACNVAQPALADAAARRHLAATLDRDALVAETQAGLARAARGLFGREGALPATQPPAPSGAARMLRLPVYEHDPDRIRLAQAVARQIGKVGFQVQVEVLERAAYAARLRAGTWDLRLDGTHGEPYDPWVWLAARSDPPAWLAASVAAGRARADAAARAKSLHAIEARLAADARWIPLLVPDRIALVRTGRIDLALGPTPYTLHVDDPAR